MKSEERLWNAFFALVRWESEREMHLWRKRRRGMQWPVASKGQRPSVFNVTFYLWISYLKEHEMIICLTYHFGEDQCSGRKWCKSCGGCRRCCQWQHWRFSAEEIVIFRPLPKVLPLSYHHHILLWSPLYFIHPLSCFTGQRLVYRKRNIVWNVHVLSTVRK